MASIPESGRGRRLDHPAALSNYLKAGLIEFKRDLIQRDV